jgi:dTDP-4-amino-4,6-dideoxygalactose transaminase
MNGIKPIFCDIKPNDFTIDESLIEGLITPKTSAIVAVHVYGYPCAVKEIDDIAKRHGLKVIYDSAHAFGERINGRPITDFGDVSMYSFHATKVFHTIEGGALVYNKSGYSHAFDLYKNFGITGPETVEAVGLNAKMNEFQAAMGIVNLRYLNEEIARRKTVVKRYRKLLANVSGVSFPSLREDVEYNFL